MQEVVDRDANNVLRGEAGERHRLDLMPNVLEVLHDAPGQVGLPGPACPDQELPRLHGSQELRLHVRLICPHCRATAARVTPWPPPSCTRPSEE